MVACALVVVDAIRRLPRGIAGSGHVTLLRDICRWPRAALLLVRRVLWTGIFVLSIRTDDAILIRRRLNDETYISE